MFMAVATSYTATKDSDSKVCTLMAVNQDNELFVLDMWSAQTMQQHLISAALHMADRWLCPTVHVEAIKEGISVYNDLYSIISTRASDMADVQHLPKVKKFNPGMTSKSAKIASLLRRVEYGKIKMPLRERYTRPWKALFDQIEEFNPEARDGGLQHDDELDTVSMSMYIIRGKPGRSPTAEDSADDLMERFRNGETHDDFGFPIIHGLDIRNLTPDDIAAHMSQNKGPDGRSKV